MPGLSLLAANDNPPQLTTSRSAELMYHLAVQADRAAGDMRDVVAAHKWLTVAAISGCDRARRYRRRLAAEMTLVELGESQRQVREWFDRHIA